MYNHVKILGLIIKFKTKLKYANYRFKQFEEMDFFKTQNIQELMEDESYGCTNQDKIFFLCTFKWFSFINMCFTSKPQAQLFKN